MDPILVSPQTLIGIPLVAFTALIIAAVKIGRLLGAHLERIVDLEVEVGLAVSKKVPPAESLRQRVADLEEGSGGPGSTNTGSPVPKT